jgi:hypothetical protein
MAGLNFGLSILALALTVFGLLVLWWRSRIGGEIALMADTPTSKARDIAKIAPGTLVEVKGTLRCASPLTAEYSQQPCVYFKAEMTREEIYYDTGSDGKQRRNTRRTILHSNIKHAPCQIQDDSGTVALDLDGAEIEAPETVRRVVNPGSAALGTILSIASGGSNQDTFRETEFLLAADIPVYLLGEVQPGGTIGKPGKGSHNKKFVVSTKSEEERTKDLGSNMTFALWGAIALFAGAAGALIWAWVKGPV